MARVKAVPRHVGNILIDETEPIGGILEHIAHGLLTGRSQAGQVLQQRVLGKLGQNVDPVAQKRVKPRPGNIEATTKRQVRTTRKQCHHLDIQ